MGIQDRDYYRERYKKTQQKRSHHDSYAYDSRASKRSGTGLQYLSYTAFTLALLWYGADYYLSKIKTGNLPIPEPVSADNREPLDLQPGGIILKADRQGHFRGTALVNNIPMPFMIDTGATNTVLPVKMAMAAGLPFGRLIQASTAGGTIAERKTKIKSLRLGNAEIWDLDANINEHLDEVLIGMNTLKHFRITQDGNTLTLVANDRYVHRASDAKTTTFGAVPTQPPAPKPVVIKKTVICDEQNVCKTSYSDK